MAAVKSRLFQPRAYKFWVTLAICLILFLLGLPLTTSAGMFLLQLMDTYAVANALLIVGLIEMLVFAWAYGAERLHKHAEVGLVQVSKN